MAEMGRPLLPVDWGLVDKLLSIQCTKLEICGVIGVSDDTLSRRCQDEKGTTFAEYSVQKKTPGRMNLRRKQFEVALSGNVAMLIWLGKQILDQKDKSEVELSGKVDEISEADLDKRIEEKILKLKGVE